MTNFNVASDAEFRDALNIATIGDQIFVNASSISIRESFMIPSGISVFGNECIIYSSAESAFDLGSSAGVEINGFHIELQSGKGIVGNRSQNILIKNCKVTGASLSTGMSYIAININDGSDVDIRGSKIKDTIGGIYLVNCSNVNVSDNTLERVSYGNLVISGANIEILDNNITDPGYPNIEGRYNGDGMTLEIENGFVARNKVSGGFCYNVALDNSSQVTLEENLIENGVTGGLYVTNSKNLVVENNLFINNAFVGFFGVSDIGFNQNRLIHNSLYTDRSIAFSANENYFEGVTTPIFGLDKSAATNSTIYQNSNQQASIKFFHDVFLGVPFGEFVEYSLPDYLIEYPNGMYYRYSIPSDSSKLFQYNGASNKLAGIFNEDVVNQQFYIYVDTVGNLQKYAIFQFVAQSTDFSDHERGVSVLNTSNAIGSAFDDILAARIEGASLQGGLGNDWLYGGPGNDQLNGGGGYDWISYSSSKVGVTVSLPFEIAYSINEIDGVFDVEGIEGSNFDDLLVGLNGVDNQIKGLAGDDVIFGFGGDDTLYGDLGNDQLYGGLDNDHLYGGLGNDRLDGGGGYDWISYSSSNVGVTVSLPFEIAYSVNEVDGVFDVEGIEGSNFDDLLVGLSRIDNQIMGLAGNDVIFSFSGNDTLYGGPGNDQLSGGFGNDVFAFNVAESGLDIISDFDPIMDKIFISNADLMPNELSVYSAEYESSTGTFIAFKDHAFVFLAGCKHFDPVENIIFTLNI